MQCGQVDSWHAFLRHDDAAHSFLVLLDGAKEKSRISVRGRGRAERLTGECSEDGVSEVERVSMRARVSVPSGAFPFWSRGRTQGFFNTLNKEERG